MPRSKLKKDYGNNGGDTRSMGERGGRPRSGPREEEKQNVLRGSGCVRLFDKCMDWCMIIFGAMQTMHILELSLSVGDINTAPFSFLFKLLEDWLDVQKATAQG